MTRICDIENIREPMEEDFVKICHDDNSGIPSFEVMVFTHESKKRFLYETISDYLKSRPRMFLFFNFKKPCYFIQNVRTNVIDLDDCSTTRTSNVTAIVLTLSSLSVLSLGATVTATAAVLVTPPSV